MANFNCSFVEASPVCVADSLAAAAATFDEEVFVYLTTRTFLLAAFLLLLSAYYIYCERRFQVFKLSGIVGPKPLPFIGNYHNMSRSFRVTDEYMLRKYGDVVGYYEGLYPLLLVAKPEMLREIMVSQFSNFPDRRSIVGAGKTLRKSLTVTCGDDWRRIRSTVTPAFTGAKLRQILPVFQQCAESVSENLRQMKAEEMESTEWKSYFAKFGLELGGAAFFGVKLNPLDSNDVCSATYVHYIGAFFTINIRSLILIFVLLFPFVRPIIKWLDMTLFPHGSVDFFAGVIQPLLNSRRKTAAAATSLLNIGSIKSAAAAPAVMGRDALSSFLTLTSPVKLLESKTQKQLLEFLTIGGSSEEGDEARTAFVDSSTLKFATNPNRADEQKEEFQNNSSSRNANFFEAHPSTTGLTSARKGQPLSDEEIVAQSITFLLAAYEFAANVLAFLFNALATHPVEQQILRDEIQRAFDEAAPPLYRHDEIANRGASFSPSASKRREAATLDYEQLNNLPYLSQCLHETLRRWPAITRTERDCEITTQVEGVHTERGVTVGIPIAYMHMNEKYWPEPHLWQPERFAARNRQNIVPFSYMPFGQGPRNCIGIRFAMLAMKVLVAQVMHEYKVVPTARTEVDPKLADDGLGLTKTVNGLWYTFEKI